MIATRRANLPTSVRALELSMAQTVHEQKRQAFTALFKGPYVVGAGRFTDQRSQIYISGGGTSNMFLHGNLQLGLFTPSDTSQSTTGLASLADKNVSDTGNILILDLVANPESVDRRGRPTEFTWTVNAASGGAYALATGQGTLQVRYFPGGRLPARAREAGTAGLVFKGQIYTTGITNLLR
jgi:hypothetical protein